VVSLVRFGATRPYHWMHRSEDGPGIAKLRTTCHLYAPDLPGSVKLAAIMLRLLETELRPAGDAVGLIPRDTKTPLLPSFQKRVRS
jgi:hypothetical protein